MFTLYKSNEHGQIIELNNFENNCWVDIVAPTEEEINYKQKER